MNTYGSYSAKERLNYLYLFTQKSESRNPANDPLGNILGLMAPHVTPPLTAAVDNNIGSPAVAENY